MFSPDLAQALGRRVWHGDAIAIDASAHTMGHHLRLYLKLKIPPELRELPELIERVTVRPDFDSSRHSPAEKLGKIFNVHRPTPSFAGNEAFFNCFPGYDYILHFGSALASHYLARGIAIPVRTQYPTLQDCALPLVESLAQGVPPAPIVILGKVDFLKGLTSEHSWHGAGHLKWKSVLGFEEKAILLGCTHTVWGEIAGRLTGLLCRRGTRAIIYVGKLGSLHSGDDPNQVLATGSTSTLPDGSVLRWKNLFSRLPSPVVHGSHVTIPSVLQESNPWYESAEPLHRFVDPEIGWMALAATTFGARFSYLHIVSDNLKRRTAKFGLSNERAAEVLKSRDILYQRLSISVRNAIERAANEV